MKKFDMHEGSRWFGFNVAGIRVLVTWVLVTSESFRKPAKSVQCWFGTSQSENKLGLSIRVMKSLPHYFNNWIRTKRSACPHQAQQCVKVNRWGRRSSIVHKQGKRIIRNHICCLADLGKICPLDPLPLFELDDSSVVSEGSPGPRFCH